MIQLNLLPDVKQDYIKAQRSRRLALSIAFLAAAASVALLIVLLSLLGLQKRHLSDLSDDIVKQTKTLRKQPQVGKILTVQNQLKSLTGLHESKPAATRVFDYLNQVTPTEVDISSFTIDFAESTAIITGGADNLSSVNKYVDTLKFTKYKANKEQVFAFSDVVLSSFALKTADDKQEAGSRPADYTVNLSFDSSIFDITRKIALSVPNKVTTRYEVVQPTDLFKAAPKSTTPNGASN